MEVLTDGPHLLADQLVSGVLCGALKVVALENCWGPKGSDPTQQDINQARSCLPRYRILHMST